MRIQLPSTIIHCYFKNLFGSVMSDGVCAGFEPQTYLRERCKRCFRLKSKHNIPSSPTQLPPPLPMPQPTASSSNSSAVSPTSPLSNRSNKEKRFSWRSDGVTSPEYETADSLTETSSIISFKSANSRLLSNAKSMESILSNTDDRCSMVTAASGSLEFDESSERAITPTEFEYDASELRSNNARLQEQVRKLKIERQKWATKKPKGKETGQDEDLIRSLEAKILDQEKLIEEYRDENTTLTCKLQLRKRQEGTSTDQPTSDQLNAAEDLCNELIEENKQLKMEIQGLQQEVEEMQDNYREEEIEEFRELQRELEQNAKNCRVLQFKLRKSERQREQILAEKEVLAMKLEEKQLAAKSENGEDVEEVESDDGASVSNGTASETALSVHTSGRIRELESELRIAKEVSVRLHNELETAEDKRYKLEDEVFYFKEKLREIQTQQKWRDNRLRTEQVLKRQSVDLSDAGLSKELNDVLEREKDLIEQLRFTEEDLSRTRSRMQELENENEELMQKLTRIAGNGSSRGSLNKRPPMTRSASEGHAQVQLAMATTELENLGSRCDELERRNNSLTKKMLELEIDTAKRLNAMDNGDMSKEGSFRLDVEIEKDLGRLMARIHDLEKRNSELQIQLRKKITSDANIVRDKTTSVELRKEKQQRKELEGELASYKQLIAKSDNDKLIMMATKVELLNNQLNLAIERTNALHKKTIKESGATGEESYLDELKRHIEKLEKQLSEMKANEMFKTKKHDETNGPQTMPTADEIEHCCVVLASVESHTSRLCKHMEKLDNSQKDERRRSLSKDTSANIAVDLANVMAELKVIHQVLDTHKSAYPSLSRRSPVKEPSTSSPSAECSDCKQKEEQLESSKQEIAFYKKKNKELTNQVLQTEDRWTIEIEKQTSAYITKIRTLEAELEETKERLKEQIDIVNSHSATLSESNKNVEEKMAKINRLEMEINLQKKTIQEMEREQKVHKEWAIKYKKLEHIYDSEKMKFDAERTKIKAETASLKKRTDDAVNELEKLREVQDRRELMWLDEKSRLEKELNQLKRSVNKQDIESEEEEEPDQSINSFRSLGNGTGTILRGVNYRVTRVNDLGVPELKQQLNEQQKKYKELENKLYQLQSAKESLQSELTKCMESYEREKESLKHGARQAEKIRSFELDALQQKFSSRMHIIETTNKTLHTGLVQVRRERDRYKDQLQSAEKKLEDEQKAIELERKKSSAMSIQNVELEKKTKELTNEITRLRTEIRLAMDAHKADKKLWTIERKNYRCESIGRLSDEEEKDTRRITEQALSAAEQVQKQYSEYQKFYTKEVTRLNSKIRELSSDMQTKDVDHRRKVAAMSEQIKILEIDQKNLTQAKEMQLNAREVLQADQERLMHIVQQAEIQKLTRKYKLTAIIDRLTTIQKPSEDTELDHIIAQLTTIKEEDSQNAFTSSDLDSTDNYTNDTIGQFGISPRPLNASSARPGMFSSVLAANQRSLSIESTATWDGRLIDYSARSSSPVKKLVGYPDPPPSFIHNVDKLPYYDREGRLHYVPKSLIGLIGRSLSYDQYGEPLPQMKSTGTLTDDGENDELNSYPHNRSGSAGTNILYKIRREELAKGTPPSVRTIAKAFESLEKPSKLSLKRGFFNIRKSRSVDNENEKQGIFSKGPISVLNRNTASMTQIEGMDDLSSHISGRQPMSSSAYSSTIRGGRNPFKNMGSKLVERVRRSLSRSGRDRTPEAPLAVNEETSPLDEKPPISEDSSLTKKKLKKNGVAKAKKPTVV